ncbi:MAG TPA: DUF5995 family protein [Blastocatellia bacterium]|nr:DUF5995 family protein [Blastocatellia bacterium]HMV81870.1 DUF5995 family protein [Blastocatellia bacterium]HMX27081.1 DUF5995 family protein [Blastocatellia bacterium]HMY73664.1 DUF5995 family protein [Blastocatellia bacterium]HMZ20195.1 DUF5995 family protein [Blastocatellia bacterium]
MAQTIDEVIAHLTEIIDRSRHDHSRQGYFAALYRKVTISVKEGIAQNRFQNGERMQRLDVVFANRYLTAYELYRQRLRPTDSWQLAFEAAEQWRPLILQQLLLGMNAHINLDLGIAAAETCPGDELAPLQHDFDEINNILASLVLPVRKAIGDVSPWIGFLEKIDPRADDAIINFSMLVARNEAWKFALRLNALDEQRKAAAIAQRDSEIARFGRLVYQPPGVFFKLGLLAIRLRESNDISKVIDVLC